jgi:hypothetical protein
MDKHEQHWEGQARALLVNRRIIAVRYMTPAQAEGFEWHGRALVLILDDGTHLMAAADEEGNGPGALFTNNEKTPIIPTI